MKKIYTEDNLDRFFENFKSLPNTYEIEKVHHLLNNPNAKAMHRINNHFKHLKLIIMTSAFIIGITGILFLGTPKNSISGEMTKNTLKNDKCVNEQLTTDSNEINNKKPSQIPIKGTIGSDAKKTPAYSEVISQESINSIYDELENDPDIISNSQADLSSNCNWPSDTIIDKKSLYIILTKSQLKKLGVNVVHDSMYYHNSTPNGRYNGTTSNNWQSNVPKRTSFDFHMVYTSDTACTRYRWGHKFYSEVDTLVPILTNVGNDPIILWFTPNPSFFQAIPMKYQYMEQVFSELTCAKKKSPNHQFVNHWSKKNNIVLDEINSLELSTEFLEKIGFQIFKDSISLVHPSKSMFYNSGKYWNNIGTKGIHTAPFPPNPLPVIVTDEKGLKQNYFGHGKKVNFETTMFDILVPIKIPFDKLISSKNYYLIFWFYPTDEFISTLPERIRTDLKLELESITAPSSTNSKGCSYFEVCKSTLHLDNFKVYPNPAQYSISIEFETKEELSGTISLVNIAGSMVKTLVSNTIFINGRNSFPIELSGITPGIYLISINTDKGFKTQRLIISQ